MKPMSTISGTHVANHAGLASRFTER